MSDPSTMNVFYVALALINGSGKHSGLLWYGNNSCVKKVYSAGPWGLVLLYLWLCVGCNVVNWCKTTWRNGEAYWSLNLIV